MLTHEFSFGFVMSKAPEDTQMGVWRAPGYANQSTECGPESRQEGGALGKEMAFNVTRPVA